MRALNPRYLSDGRIDAEIEHPVHGWIPYTAAPDTGDPEAEAIFRDLKARPDVQPHRPQPPAKGRDNDGMLVSRAVLRLALTRHLGLSDAQVDALFRA